MPVGSPSLGVQPAGCTAVPGSQTSPAFALRCVVPANNVGGLAIGSVGVGGMGVGIGGVGGGLVSGGGMQTASICNGQQPQPQLVKQISVSGTASVTSSSSSPNEPRLSRTNLYIRGLAPETTDKDLVTMCQQFVYL